MLTETQLQQRRKCIGASEAAAVLGRSPFTTPAEVYWSKVTDPAPDKPTPAMEAGSRLEPVILDWCGERLGRPIVRRGEPVIDPTTGVLGATPDGFVEGRPELVEAKKTCVLEDWGEQGTDQIPEHYLIQAHDQMEVCARAGIAVERVWVPVLMLAGFREEWRLYAVDRDEELGRTIADRLVEWWNRHVLPRVPPDDAAPPVEVLKRLRRKPKSQVVLGANGIAAWNQYEASKAVTNTANTEEEQAKAAVLAMLGLDDPAEEALLPDGRVITFREQNSAPSVDHAMLKGRWPEAYAACVRQGRHRVLRISGTK